MHSRSTKDKQERRIGQRARYTLEFKLEAVRLVKAGQEASVTARVLGLPKQTLSNWVRLADKGALSSSFPSSLLALKHSARGTFFGGKVNRLSTFNTLILQTRRY